MNVQNTDPPNVFIERSEQQPSRVRGSLGHDYCIEVCVCVCVCVLFRTGPGAPHHVVSRGSDPHISRARR